MSSVIDRYDAHKKYGLIGMRAEFQLFHPLISDAVTTDGERERERERERGRTLFHMPGKTLILT